MTAARQATTHGLPAGTVPAVLRVGAGFDLCAVGIAAGWWQLWVLLGLLACLAVAHALARARNPPLLDVLAWRATLLPGWVSGIGAASWLLGDVPVVLAMASNPHLEATVELREGQRVVDTGPYGVVRHPMYAGAALMFLALPLVLGSLIAMLPALGLVALLVYRTAREDRTLQHELPGYAAYAMRTSSRLLPAVW